MVLPLIVVTMLDMLMLIAIRDRAVKRPVSRTCNVLVAEFREHSTDCNVKELLSFEVRRRYHG